MKLQAPAVFEGPSTIPSFSSMSSKGCSLRCGAATSSCSTIWRVHGPPEVHATVDSRNRYEAALPQYFFQLNDVSSGVPALWLEYIEFSCVS